MKLDWSGFGKQNNSATDGTISQAEDNSPCAVSTARSALHPQIPAESIAVLNHTSKASAAELYPSLPIRLHNSLSHKTGTAACMKFDHSKVTQ